MEDPNTFPHDDPTLDPNYLRLLDEEADCEGGDYIPPPRQRGQKVRGKGRTKTPAPRRKHAPADGSKPIVRYEPSPTVYKQAVDGVSSILAGNGVFSQAGRLITTVTLTEKTTFGRGDRITFDRGATIMAPLSADDIQALIQEHVSIERYDARAGDYVEKEPPANLIKGVMRLRNDMPFPVLSGIANAPCLRSDGSILDKEGYDEATGLYVDFQGATFPPVPDKPTVQDVTTAWALLEDLLSEFPFAGENPDEDGADAKEDATALLNKSVALSMLITAETRSAYDTAPLTAISAHTPGTGKSTLASVAGIIPTGHKPAGIIVPKEDVEFEKAFFALLVKGSPVCLLDNITRPLCPDMLCSALTQSTIEARILGATRMGTASTSAAFIATGNNLQICGDLIRRTMLCQLDRNTERPAEYPFKRNVIEWTHVHRAELVCAILTIMRAYHVAGRPKPEGFRPLGSFEAWSDWVRGALVYWGYPDPIESQRRLEAEDPDKATFGRVLECWHSAYDRNPMPLSAVFKDFSNTSDPRRNLYLDLQEALEEAIPHRGDLRPSAVGRWLERRKGGFANGYQLIRRERSAQGWLWRVNPPKP